MLVDDDVATGTTRDAICHMLRRQGANPSFMALCDLAQTHAMGAELVDCRDFLAGSRDAGLVVAGPQGRLGRAPYVLPYVLPSGRAGVPVRAEMSFSRSIWTLNQRFFSSLSTALRISDMAAPFAALCDELGFPQSMTMDALSRWHLAHL